MTRHLEALILRPILKHQNFGVVENCCRKYAYRRIALVTGYMQYRTIFVLLERSIAYISLFLRASDRQYRAGPTKPVCWQCKGTFSGVIDVREHSIPPGLSTGYDRSPGTRDSYRCPERHFVCRDYMLRSCRPCASRRLRDCVFCFVVQASAFQDVIDCRTHTNASLHAFFILLLAIGILP
jgi:hypothetical protein